ncbi:MAG: hypothetical protein M1827_004277 [Pycnora praestabilis]|nr:MAG: hypothetical protein M1827_004277 [Pycnora praestabilis]
MRQPDESVAEQYFHTLAFDTRNIPPGWASESLPQAFRHGQLGRLNVTIYAPESEFGRSGVGSNPYQPGIRLSDRPKAYYCNPAGETSSNEEPPITQSTGAGAGAGADTLPSSSHNDQFASEYQDRLLVSCEANNVCEDAEKSCQCIPITMQSPITLFGTTTPSLNPGLCHSSSLTLASILNTQMEMPNVKRTVSYPSEYCSDEFGSPDMTDCIAMLTVMFEGKAGRIHDWDVFANVPRLVDPVYGEGHPLAQGWWTRSSNCIVRLSIDSRLESTIPQDEQWDIETWSNIRAAGGLVILNHCVERHQVGGTRAVGRQNKLNLTVYHPTSLYADQHGTQPWNPMVRLADRPKIYGPVRGAGRGVHRDNSGASTSSGDQSWTIAVGAGSAASLPSSSLSFSQITCPAGVYCTVDADCAPWGKGQGEGRTSCLCGDGVGAGGDGKGNGGRLEIRSVETMFGGWKGLVGVCG